MKKLEVLMYKYMKDVYQMEVRHTQIQILNKIKLEW